MNYLSRFKIDVIELNRCLFVAYSSYFNLFNLLQLRIIMKRKILFVLFAVILTACSSKDLYEVGQDHQKDKCLDEAISGKEYNDCLNTPQKPFEEYEKERKAVLKK